MKPSEVVGSPEGVGSPDGVGPPEGVGLPEGGRITGSWILLCNQNH